MISEPHTAVADAREDDDLASASATANQSSKDMCSYPNLRTHREQRGLTQAKLAALANVSKDLISSTEKHNKHRKIKLLDIIHALNEHERTRSYGVIDPDKELSC
ncbi:MAG: helix-turn-helix transcriptional regulator [Thiohalocapsa sp.]